MVSLVTRSEYFREFTTNPYTNAFLDFLFDRRIQSVDHLNLANADDLALHVLKAVQEDNKESFEKAYGHISRRRPKRESDWLYNDILLFSLTIGILKFCTTSDWLIETLDVRSQHANEEKKLISQTLIDALRGNFNNRSNHLPLILVIQHILELPVQNAEQINSVYQSLTQQTFPFHETFFLNAVSLRAIDVIILVKELTNWEQRQQTQTFIRIFTGRVRLLSNLLWAAVMLAAVAVTAWFVYHRLWPFDPKQADQLDLLLNILTLVGAVPPIPLALLFRSRIVHLFERWIFHFWGYKFSQGLTEEFVE